MSERCCRAYWSHELSCPKVQKANRIIQLVADNMPLEVEERVRRGILEILTDDQCTDSAKGEVNSKS